MPRKKSMPKIKSKVVKLKKGGSRSYVKLGAGPWRYSGGTVGKEPKRK